MNKPLDGLSYSSTLLQFRIDKTYYDKKSNREYNIYVIFREEIGNLEIFSLLVLNTGLVTHVQVLKSIIFYGHYIVVECYKCNIYFYYSSLSVHHINSPISV